ncbi:hypothetical protein NN561_020279 [Cricetulus griseus]
MAQKENTYPWPYGSQKVRSRPHSSPHLPRKASPRRQMEHPADGCPLSASDVFPKSLHAEPSLITCSRILSRCCQPESEGFCRAESACHMQIITGTEQAAVLCFRAVNPTL